MPDATGDTKRKDERERDLLKHEHLGIFLSLLNSSHHIHSKRWVKGVKKLWLASAKISFWVAGIRGQKRNRRRPHNTLFLTLYHLNLKKGFHSFIQYQQDEEKRREMWKERFAYLMSDLLPFLLLSCLSFPPFHPSIHPKGSDDSSKRVLSFLFSHPSFSSSVGSVTLFFPNIICEKRKSWITIISWRGVEFFYSKTLHEHKV